MNVLALDTASPEPAVSLSTEETVFQEPLAPDRRASENLLAALERCRERARLPLEAVQRIAVCSGPGSFTGVRVGLATAWGLSRALGIPVEAVSTLEAMAETARAPGRSRVAAVLDAGRGDVVFARFGLDSPRAKPLDSAPRTLRRETAAAELEGWTIVSLPRDLLSPGSVSRLERIAGALARAVAEFPRENAEAPPHAIYARRSAAEEKLGAP